MRFAIIFFLASIAMLYFSEQSNQVDLAQEGTALEDLVNRNLASSSNSNGNDDDEVTHDETELKHDDEEVTHEDDEVTHDDDEETRNLASSSYSRSYDDDDYSSSYGTTSSGSSSSSSTSSRSGQDQLAGIAAGLIALGIIVTVIYCALKCICPGKCCRVFGF